ncbi:MAG: DUF1501 domain-containing protein [Cytophagales bacterium]|nr:DUF1501 domain-containing protein [Rhizobacter sp.]
MSIHPKALDMNRRQWLMRNSAGLAGALGLGTVANLTLGTKRAWAGDYKALVCVFLYGGNDGLNTIVPTDTARYNQYAAVRRGLALPQASLLPLSGINYGMHPSLAALAPAWAEGRLAPVFNLGTLVRPMTKAQFRAEPSSSTLVPGNLFSHSDQQIEWETGSTSPLTRSGWGGRASAALQTVNPVISVAGSTRFGLTETVSPLVLPNTPGDSFGAWVLSPDVQQYAPYVARKDALNALYAAGHDTELGDAYAAAQRNAFSVSERLGGLVAIEPGGVGAIAAIDTAFAPLMAGDGELTTGLAGQLYQIAKLIVGSATVGGNKQMFYASLDGFDTHGNQLVAGAPTTGNHANLLKELGDAMGAFYNAMKALGLGGDVTAFTQSDFGRTFTPNNSTGTDHAWGNTHLVLGGAVVGGRSYGSFPDLVLGGNNDVGVDSWELQGRWLPTTSVDQYAATLLGWFGANDTQLNSVLPNLVNFGANRRLGFL